MHYILGKKLKTKTQTKPSMNISILHLKDMITNHVLSNPNGLTHILEWTIHEMMKMVQTEFLAQLDSDFFGKDKIYKNGK